MVFIDWFSVYYRVLHVMVYLLSPDEKNGDDKKRGHTPTFQGSAWQNCRRMVYVQRSAQKGFFGHWPIPEAFWPDLNSPTLVSWQFGWRVHTRLEFVKSVEGTQFVICSSVYNIMSAIVFSHVSMCVISFSYAFQTFRKFHHVQSWIGLHTFSIVVIYIAGYLVFIIF